MKQVYSVLVGTSSTVIVPPVKNVKAPAYVPGVIAQGAFCQVEDTTFWTPNGGTGVAAPTHSLGIELDGDVEWLALPSARRHLQIAGDATEMVFLSRNGPAVLDEGGRLSALQNRQYPFYSGQISGITATGATVLVEL